MLDLAGHLRYVGEVPKSFSCRPGRSRTAAQARGGVFSQPGVKKRAAKSFRLEQQTGPAAVWQVKVVDVAVGTDGQPRRRLILARHRETGERKYFITNARGIGAAGALGRVRTLECGARVPRRQKRNRLDPVRGAQLCVVETSFGVVPDSLGLRQFAHAAALGVKIWRSPWSRSVESWSSLVGNI